MSAIDNSESRTGKDSAGAVLAGLAIVSGLVQLFYLPFLFGPLAEIAVLTSLVMSTKNRRLGGIAACVIFLGFLIGASIAVWYSRALY